MKLSNIRIEKKENGARLVCDIDCSFSKSKQMWFSVQEEYADWLTSDVYDAFLVACLYPAMYYDEPIIVEGNVSQKIYFNICHYIMNIVKVYREEMRSIDIKVSGFSNPEKRDHMVGTGFSAGVDSFTTFVDHFINENDSSTKISALFFFNVGSHGGGTANARRVFEERYDLLKQFPKDFGLPFVKMDSNLFDFYIDKWEFDAGVFCRATGILVFQRVLSLYYLSNDYSYMELFSGVVKMSTGCSLSALAENIINPMLSPAGLEIITDGAQYTRTEKTEKIASFPFVQKYLNVCVNHWQGYESAKNCSHCPKCLRTLTALDALGLLDQYKNVFDLDIYKKHKKEYGYWLVSNYQNNVFAKDNVDFARLHGMQLPSNIEVKLFMFSQRLKVFLSKIKRHLFL